MRLNLPVSDICHPVPEGAVLVSRTDLKGIITYCNRTFCEVSGYSEAELIGAPHNLIRHPDVPAELFADSWRCIQAGKPWNGVIKNRRKNGDCYWVEANITPLIEGGRTVGYVSLRYAATDEQIAEAQKTYRAVQAGRPLPSVDQLAHYERYVTHLQQRIAEKIVELEKYYDSNEEELRIGSDIMSRITRVSGKPDPGVRLLIRSAAYYSGDIILTARTPANVLHILLADAVGHGLTAAMNVLPLSQAFYAMTNKGFPISRIAEELNSKIHNFMPVDRFVAAALVSINFRERLVDVWNGGIPAPVLIDSRGKVLHKWNSRNLPLGITGKQDFSTRTDNFHYEDDCQLFMFSDGMPEAESPDGIPFGKERIEALLRGMPPTTRFDGLVGALERHLCGRPARDDVSVAMVDIPLDVDQEEISCRLDSAASREVDSDWQIAVGISAHELKYLDIVPLLMQLIAGIHGAAEHHSALFLILSELFNNALDHGVLQLDSGLKSGTDGFDSYLRFRREKLHSLENGRIEIEIRKVSIDGRYGVRIRVADSGEGFDHQGTGLDPSELIEAAHHGRGIALVRSVAHRLEYPGKGNEAIAYYICAGI